MCASREQLLGDHGGRDQRAARRHCANSHGQHAQSVPRAPRGQRTPAGRGGLDTGLRDRFQEFNKQRRHRRPISPETADREPAATTAHRKQSAIASITIYIHIYIYIHRLDTAAGGRSAQARKKFFFEGIRSKLLFFCHQYNIMIALFFYPLLEKTRLLTWTTTRHETVDLFFPCKYTPREQVVVVVFQSQIFL